MGSANWLDPWVGTTCRCRCSSNLRNGACPRLIYVLSCMVRVKFALGRSARLCGRAEGSAFYDGLALAMSSDHNPSQSQRSLESTVHRSRSRDSPRRRPLTWQPTTRCPPVHLRLRRTTYPLCFIPTLTAGRRYPLQLFGMRAPHMSVLRQLRPFCSSDIPHPLSAESSVPCPSEDIPPSLPESQHYSQET